MTEVITKTIRTVDLNNNLFIGDRTVVIDRPVYSLDINQSDGSFAIAQPLNPDGSYGGNVVLYPQNWMTSDPIIEYKTFNRVGSLYYPLDVRFDYLRRKLWIADTGNNRVLKVNLNTNQIDLTIDTDMIYPHSLAVELNTGDIFVKAYETYDLSSGTIFYYQKDGVLLSRFSFSDSDTASSSSSSSKSMSMSNSDSSLSSFAFPSFPSPRSMTYDSNRSRVWWLDGVRIYMADIRNKQIQTYDIRTIVNHVFVETVSISIELATGNAFVVAKDVHNDSFILQVSRDNNALLGVAYVGE